MSKKAPEWIEAGEKFLEEAMPILFDGTEPAKNCYWLCPECGNEYIRQQNVIIKELCRHQIIALAKILRLEEK